MIGVTDREWATDLIAKKNLKNKLKTENNVHAKPVTVGKIFFKIKKKKKKEEPENVVEKRKKLKKKEKMKDNTNTFIFNDFWVWDWCMFFFCIVFFKLYYWKFCWSVQHEEERYISLRI